MWRMLDALIDSVVVILDGLAGFFRLIWNVLNVIFDFIVELPKFLRLSTNFVADVPAYLSWLPGAVIPVCVVTIIIAIIWKIFGRT